MNASTASTSVTQTLPMSLTSPTVRIIYIQNPSEIKSEREEISVTTVSTEAYATVNEYVTDNEDVSLYATIAVVVVIVVFAAVCVVVWDVCFRNRLSYKISTEEDQDHEITKQPESCLVEDTPHVKKLDDSNRSLNNNINSVSSLV